MVLLTHMRESAPLKIRHLLRTLPICLVLLALVQQTRAQNYNLLGATWPAGSNLVMKLGLGPTTVALQDGSSSWNASAADALDIWNGYVDFITLSSIASATVPEISGDGVNATFFSSTIFGDTFGDDTLAVTVFLTSGEVMTEADVICNTAFHYDSYRGALQTAAADIHRIFVHEFGHVLGLGHVTNTPPGQALMEPGISDLDHLAPDDIAGVRQLYGANIMNLPEPGLLREGDSFTYSLLDANNGPTSYSALGLPPGITIDSASGHINGSAMAGGVYGVVITAHGPIANAYGTFQMTVAGFENVPGLLRILDLDAFAMVADPIRPRIYAGGFTGINMIDTETFAVMNLLKGDQRFALSVSADSSKLLFVDGYANASQLKRIDLNSLQQLPALTIPVNYYATWVLDGLNERDYIASWSDAPEVVQFDATTGALQKVFASGSDRPQIAISPDRRTLFVTRPGTSGELSAYDISTPEPTLLHQFTGYFGYPAPSPDGQYLYAESPGSIIQAHLPDLSPAISFGSVAFGADIVSVHSNGSIYQSHYGDGYTSGAIWSYDPVSLQQTADSDLGGLNPTTDLNNGWYDPFALVLDSSGKYLFVTVEDYSGRHGEQIWVFSTDLASFPPPPIDPSQNLLNISTRARVESGEDAMIGGFIVQGPDPKKVLIRGLGSSLPLTGALSDPILDLYDSTGKLIASNNDWASERLDILGTQLAPSSEREAAILMTLDPGAYTAVVHDRTNQPGQALVEVYDLAPGDSLLANISTRGKVEIGDGVMIGGFIIGGEDQTKVLVRAIGPSLAGQGILFPLVDPVLEIHDSAGTLISTNDNWRSTQQNEIIATGIAPTNDKESAILLTLDPASYTAIVRGQNSTTGVALVEVYNLDADSAGSK